MRRFTAALGLSALLLAGACAPTKFNPSRATPDQRCRGRSSSLSTILDGCRRRHTRQRHRGTRQECHHGAPANQDTLDARKVTDAISQTLVKEIDKLGLP